MESGARDLNECVVRGGDEYEFPMNGIRIYSSQLSIMMIMYLLFWLKTAF